MNVFLQVVVLNMGLVGFLGKPHDYISNVSACWEVPLLWEENPHLHEILKRVSDFQVG